jgi:hypothetical protein
MSEHSRLYAMHSDEECERRKRLGNLAFQREETFPPVDTHAASGSSTSF